MYRLRALELEDAQRMLEWMHDRDTMECLRFNGSSQSLGDVEAFIAEAMVWERQDSKHIHRAIVDKTDRYCGTVSLKDIKNKTAEFAIVVHPDSIGKGAGEKATMEMLREAFYRYGLEKVYLNVKRTNIKAVRLYKKTGFKYTHTTREEIRGTGVVLDWYEIIREDFIDGAPS